VNDKDRRSYLQDLARGAAAATAYVSHALEIFCKRLVLRSTLSHTGSIETTHHPQSRMAHLQGKGWRAAAQRSYPTTAAPLFVQEIRHRSPLRLK
jgi:hypothetical protein